MGKNIHFDSIIYSGGGYYNVSTRTFTCPVSGIYLFSIQAWDGLGNRFIDITLYKDDIEIITASTVDSKYGSADYETGHAVTITFCERNSRVFVRVSRMSSGVVFCPSCTTFAGMLLYGSARAKNQVLACFCCVNSRGGCNMYRHYV